MSEDIQTYAILDNLLPPEPSRCAEKAAETSTVKGGSLGFPPWWRAVGAAHCAERDGGGGQQAACFCWWVLWQ